MTFLSLREALIKATRVIYIFRSFFSLFPSIEITDWKKKSRKNSFNKISDNRLSLSLTEAAGVKEIRPGFYSACIPNTIGFGYLFY